MRVSFGTRSSAVLVCTHARSKYGSNCTDNRVLATISWYCSFPIILGRITGSVLKPETVSSRLRMRSANLPLSGWFCAFTVKALLDFPYAAALRFRSRNFAMVELFTTVPDLFACHWSCSSYSVQTFTRFRARCIGSGRQRRIPSGVWLLHGEVHVSRLL